MNPQTPPPDEHDVTRLAERWEYLTLELRDRFRSKVSLEGILFLIGVRELGAHPNREFTKEEKRDLINLGICAVLAPSGYYQLTHQDQDGWPHWEQLQPLPAYDVNSQEIFLKSHILDYFDEIL